MVDIEEVYVRDLYKKHKGSELYKGFYSIGKKIYQDDGEVINKGFALEKQFDFEIFMPLSELHFS